MRTTRLSRTIVLCSVLSLVGAGRAFAHGVQAGFAVDNGDANGDLKRDLSDAVYLLRHIFLGSPAPVPLALCGTDKPAVSNGDIDGNGGLALNDVIRFLSWLVTNRRPPVTPCGNGAPRVVPSEIGPYGLSYGGWAAEWLKWMFGAPRGANPVEDLNGEFCDVGQSGPVWFLAGTRGATGVERTCTVPRGRAIFYPVVNWFWIDCPNSPDEDLTDAEVSDIMTGLAALSCNLSSELDGVPLLASTDTAVRAVSGSFSMVLPENHIVEGCAMPIPPGPSGRLLTSGDFLMLAPLPPGEHTMHLHGATCDPESGEPFFETEVTYHLTVE